MVRRPTSAVSVPFILRAVQFVLGSARVEERVCACAGVCACVHVLENFDVPLILLNITVCLRS